MRVAFIILIFFISSTICAQNTNEHLKFDIKFGMIKGGEVFFQTSDTLVSNIYATNARLHGYTTGFAHMLYKVNDSFESIIDKSNNYPIKSFKNVSEQNYRFNNEVHYYHHRDSAWSKETGWHHIEPGVSDVSALFYNLRFSGILDTINRGDTISLPFWDTGEWYYVDMIHDGIEIIKTNFGKRECIVLKPLNIEGKFFSKIDPMVVWLTNDQQRLPVLMKLNFNIGSVKCVLVNS
ncbi:MAG: DUF3108 domain-containing protein [Prolixibacteraceae bacterium]|jgi:hypothetical protein|nr:DUF3108 domain-containing protein [Prolixibacteraceae bacterium]